MTSSDSHVVIREARPQDYQDLAEMGDVYGGKDYLLDHFLSYFDDPNIYPLVAEVDGKVVGFYMNQYIDGGLTLIKRAARVHPAHRGRGIFHLLSQALDDHRQQFWPGVKFEVFGTTERADRAATEFREKGFESVIRKTILNMSVRLRHLKGLDTHPQDSARVKVMTYDDVRLLFSNTSAIDRLVPKRIIFNWFIGYNILEDNIKYLVNSHAMVFASSSMTSDNSISEAEHESGGHNGTSFTPEDINNIDVLSFGLKVHTLMGHAHQIDLYTSDGYSTSRLRAHLIKHFQDFVSSTEQDGITMVTFNSNVSKEVMQNLLSDLGVVESIPTLENEVIFYRRKVASC